MLADGLQLGLIATLNPDSQFGKANREPYNGPAITGARRAAVSRSYEWTTLAKRRSERDGPASACMALLCRPLAYTRTDDNHTARPTGPVTATSSVANSPFLLRLPASR